MVADGHLTKIPLESVYSGVVSIRSIHLVTFLTEHFKHALWATDIGNAYLESETNEKLSFVAGSEFGPERKGHVLIVHKALYGLRTSGKRWFEKLSACLRDMGFVPCRADTSIWMRLAKDGKSYEYIATYVDDLLIAMKNPQEVIDQLMDTYKFKLKGTSCLPLGYGLLQRRARSTVHVTQEIPRKGLQ